jgi:hypothetical protein
VLASPESSRAATTAVVRSSHPPNPDLAAKRVRSRLGDDRRTGGGSPLCDSSTVT